MAVNAGIFGDGTNLKDRYVPDHKRLRELVIHWKSMGLKIVLVSGTWDLFHIGHAQYLEKAKKEGDILIVGVDCDEKVRAKKGPHRPVAPETERVNILSHIRHVDVITLKKLTDPKEHLIKIVKPNVLVVSETTGHSDKSLQRRAKHCGAIKILRSQAKTSTSAKVRLLHVSGADRFAKDITPELTALIERNIIENARKLAKDFAPQIPILVEKTISRLRNKKV